MNSETLIAIQLAIPTPVSAATMQAELPSMALFSVCIGATLFVFGRKTLSL